MGTNLVKWWVYILNKRYVAMHILSIGLNYQFRIDVFGYVVCLTHESAQLNLDFPSTFLVSSNVYK